MSAAYDIEAWKDFATMIGGASAALAGLLIVAMSINIDEILKFADLPARAAAALIAMLSPLVVAVLVLVPGQSTDALGAELLVFGVLLGWVLLGRLARYGRNKNQTPGQWLLGTGGPLGVLAGGLALAGLGLILGSLGGLMWLAPAVLAAVLGGTAQAWVLLIEIRR